MEDNIFGLKGLTRQDWEKWQSDYQKELEGYSDLEKEDLFVDVIFNEALDKDSRLSAFENSSREEKIKLYNYYTDELGPRQEQEALGLVPTREEVREKPFGELIDFFTKYPSEYTPEDIMERANVHERKENNKKEQEQSFGYNPFLDTKVSQVTEEQLDKTVEQSKKDNISERLEDYEDFKYSEDDLMSVSVVQEAQRQMAGTEDYDKKKEIFDKTDKDLEELHKRKEELLQQLQNSSQAQKAMNTLALLFDDFAMENKMYKQFENTGKVDFTDAEKVDVMLDLYALQNTDYGSTAGNLFNNAIQKKVAEYNEKHEKLENVGKGLWGFASKVGAVPAYIMGVFKAVNDTIDGENFIDSVTDNEYIRIANNISQYGMTWAMDNNVPFYDSEWIEAQKELAVSDMQLLRAPGQESNADFSSSAFWGDMINQYGFTAASMMISGGTSLAGRIALGSVRNLTGALYLNAVGKILDTTRNLLQGFNNFRKITRPLGVFANLALTAGYETTTSTLQDKLDFLEQGTEEIKNRYADNEIANMGYTDKVQYLSNKGYELRVIGNQEDGNYQTVLVKDGKMLNAEYLDRYLKQEMVQDATDVIEAAENNKEIPEEYRDMAASLNKDMEYLSKTADIQARAGFITRELVYGTIAGTLKATLQSGTVQQALKNMGFGPKFGVTEEGKAFLKTYLPKFMLNKYGYGALTASKEVGGEFIEEWEDVIASDFSKGIGNTYMSNYYKTKYEGASEDILKNQLGQAIIKGFENVDPFSEEALSSGIYGALSAALGGVSINRNFMNSQADPVSWFTPITWRSSLVGGYREGVQQYEEISQTINAIQEWVDNPENREKWDGSIGTLNWMEKISNDIESKDEYMYRNDNLAKMIHDIFILKKIKDSPIAEQVLEQIERGSKATQLSEEELKNLIEEYRNTLLNNPGSEEISDDAILERIQTNSLKMKDLYTEIDKEQGFLDSTLQDYIDQDLKESLIYGRILYKDLNKRRKQMSDELSNVTVENSVDNSTISLKDKNTFAVYGQNGMNETLVGYSKRIKELAKKVVDLKSSKRTDKSSWSEKQELELRRAKVELKKLKNLQRKAEEQKKQLLSAYEENTLLSELDIMSLDDDARAFILDINNKKNYSEKQREIIDNVRNQLYRRSLERQDGRLYIDMVLDLAKTLVDSKAFEDYQFALLMDTKTAGIYARRFAEKVKSDRIKKLAKDFSTKKKENYSNWKVAYNNMVKNMSKQDLNLFDVLLMSQYKDSNMFKYMSEQGKKRDFINFINSKNLKLKNHNGRVLPINTEAFEELIDIIQNNNLDPTDLNNIQKIKEIILNYSSVGNNTQGLDFEIIKDNYEEILKQYNDYLAARNKQREMPKPKTLEKKTESPKNALDDLIDSLNNEEGGEDSRIEGSENLDKEGTEYNIVEDDVLIEFYKDSPIVNVVSALIEGINNSMTIGKADNDGLIKKAFKYTIQSMSDMKELGNKKAFLDEFTKQLAKRNLGPKTAQFRLLVNTVVTSVRNKNTNNKQSAAKTYSSEKTHNINALAISPMDVFSEGFDETQNMMYSPYQMFFKQYKIEEFLFDAYTDKTIFTSDFLNNIFFISDANIETAESQIVSLSSMLKSSFEQANVEFKDEESIPIIAVVPSNKGTLIVKDANGKDIRVLPIAVYPTTGSASGGSTELANFRKLAVAQRDVNPDSNTFILDDNGKPLQPLKESPLASKKAPLEATNRFEENSSHNVLDVMQNDMSNEEKEEFLNATEEEKKTILGKLRDRFFASLGVGKSKKSGKPVLVFTGQSNLKGESAIADLFIKTPEETVNSEGKHLHDEGVTIGEFNDRTKRYQLYLNEILEELSDKLLSPTEFGALNDGKLNDNQQKIINSYQERLNSVLGRYINIPSIYEYKINISINNGSFDIEVQLYNSARKEADTVIAHKNTDEIIASIDMNNLFFTSDGSYRQYNNEPFAKWQVDYEDITGESEWSKDKENSSALWAMRNSIFFDNLLYSRRKSFKYRPIGIKINSPFKKAKKELPPKKPSGDSDSGIGMPPKGNPNLVEERKKKLEGLQEDAKRFRQGEITENEASVTKIVSTETRWLQADINYYPDSSELGDKEFLGATTNGTMLYRKGNSVIIANKYNQYVELNLGYDIANLNSDIIVDTFSTYEYNNEKVLSEFEGSAENILIPLLVIGKELISYNKLEGTGSPSELKQKAALKYGNTIDTIARDCASGKYDNLVEEYLKASEDDDLVGTKKAKFIAEHRGILDLFTNMTPTQAMIVLAELHKRFKSAFNGHTILSEELLCRGTLEVRDDKGNKKHIRYRGLTDIVTIGPDGKVYIYDVKTYKLDNLGLEKLQQYQLQLSMYAKAIAEQLGVSPADIVIGIIPVKLNYDNNKVTDAVKDKNTGDTILYKGNELFTLDNAPSVEDFIMQRYLNYYLNSNTMAKELFSYIEQEEVQMEIISQSEIDEAMAEDASIEESFSFTNNNENFSRTLNTSNESVIDLNIDVNSDWNQLTKEQLEYIESKGWSEEMWNMLPSDARQGSILEC